MSRLSGIMCSIFCLTALVALILILCSLSTLNYSEVGLNYSDWFKVVENTSYKHGIHFIGLGHSFKRYNLALTTIEFSNA